MKEKDTKCDASVADSSGNDIVPVPSLDKSISNVVVKSYIRYTYFICCTKLFYHLGMCLGPWFIHF